MDTDNRAALERVRDRIRALDGELVALVAERRELVLAVGRLKESLGLPVLDPPQEARVVRRAAELAREAGTDPELVRDVLWRIIASARAEQEGQGQCGPVPSAPPAPTTDPAEGGL